MSQESAIGKNSVVKQLELLSLEEGKAIGWSSGSLTNLSIGGGDPRIIYAPTAPTTRNDGSSLQIQDQWRDTTNGSIYYWVYNSWCEEAREMVLSSNDPTARAATIALYGNIFTNRPLAIEKITVSGNRTGNTHSGTAYWGFGVSAQIENSTSTETILLPTLTESPNSIGGSVNTLFWSVYTFSSAMLVPVGRRLILNYQERAGAVTVTNVASTIQARWVYV